MSYQTVTIRSPNYYSGRNAKPRLIVLHTIECPCAAGQARNAATYLANPSVQASCHWAVDPGWLVKQVDEADTAWAAPGGNSDGIQIEQAGRAGFGPADWARPEAQAMLRVTAQVMADASKRWGIPLRHLSNAQLEVGQAGVVGHVQVSEVYQRSDHWDPGPAYPYDLVIGWANELAGTSSAAGTVEPARPEPPFPFNLLEAGMAAKTYRYGSDPRQFAVVFPFKIHVPNPQVLAAWQAEGWVEKGDPKVFPDDTAIKPLVTVDEYGMFEQYRPAPK